MRYMKWIAALVAALWMTLAVAAGADLDINTPAINALRAAMQARHAKLSPYFANGGIGLTRDGGVAMHDANAVPLAERQSVQGLVSDENRDRSALYREIARANGHPEWEADVRATFAQRWVDKAARGWWVQDTKGAWIKK